jgi:hypothetical protein
LHKHKGQKIENLRIIKLYPWFSRGGYPPHKCLLVEETKKEAWEAPPHYLEFVYNDILNDTTYHIFPLRLPVWCWLYRYKFHRSPYSEKQLCKLLGEELP